MKKLYALIAAAVVLSFAAAAVFLMLSPDIVPMHYNFAGEIDRFGSKYENLIFPFLSLLTGAVFLLCARSMGRRGEVGSVKALLITGAVTVFFFDGLGIFFMQKDLAFAAGEAVSVSAGQIVRFTGAATGILLICLGCAMPRVARNSLFGLRTRWSMASDRLWEKSQRFAGRSAAGTGALMTALALWSPEGAVLYLSGAAVLVWAAACVLASYLYYRAEKTEP
ncbi:MAG: SdpI family protein [Clostridiales bacterium]|nr:SdpI family protein [Candidatus Apopatocola equi]